jgi:hypothetical protein
MANPEHVKILEQGVGQWNKWREEHPEVRPDPSEADLFELCLIEADFSGANLTLNDSPRGETRPGQPRPRDPRRGETWPGRTHSRQPLRCVPHRGGL